MYLTPFEVAIHTYGLATIIPTLLGNALLLFLIIKQNWRKNIIEGILITTICLLDLIFSLNIISRYIFAFATDLSVLKIQEGGTKLLDPTDQFTCDWSGALLFITMHSSSVLVAALSYVRYIKIVKQVNYSSWTFVALIGLPVSVVVTLAITGAALKQFVLMPGGLGCHVWNPTRDDPIRTPIQIYFSYNILIYYIITVFCYTRIACYHNYVLDNINRIQAKKTRKVELLINEPSECYIEDSELTLHEHSVGGLISQTTTHDILPLSPIDFSLKTESTNSISSHEERIIGYFKHEIKDQGIETKPVEVMDLDQQKHQVKIRIVVILGIYTLCHIPECVIEQMEILIGYTRTSEVDSICTHFRSLIGLANCLVVLILHTQTRRKLVFYWSKLKAIFERK